MTTHPVADALDSTAALIQLGWCQGASAMTIKGEPCSPDDPDARAWCLSGAMHIASMDVRTRYWARRLLTEITGLSVENWNDEPLRTIEEVLVALGQASIAAKKLDPLEDLADPEVREGSFLKMMALLKADYAPPTAEQLKAWYTSGLAEYVTMASVEPCTEEELTEIVRLKEELLVSAF
jgi:hypothetical protein